MFAPFIILICNHLDQRQFNRLRSKLIGLHAQTITDFCHIFSIDDTTRQHLIRMARYNGKRLGLLA
ncbi:electron transporter [Nostoc sp. CENA67]|uniref:Electron transporter n=1 Tax=Amazonocrinis nigriterrae CENA67 TaxID=2794033 RepID=A0A8J7HNU2_9NOST|nr:electron transporter [Amazonocrinis nigriterrae]MBH8562882.1 electron transporter [Amazonocrinis nigriterrae CENA67]